MNALVLLDYASVIVFAATGALAASRAQLDILGFAFLACLTAVGGGTVRDLLLDRNPVFWLENPGTIGAACATAALVFFTAHLLDSRLRALNWLDACALAVAVAAGVAVARAQGHAGAVPVIMGMITGTMGGLARDVVVREVPMVLRQGQLYVTAAFGGALAAEALAWGGLPGGWTLVACAGVTFGLRAGSMAFGWSLPVYRSQPPRS